MRDVLDEVIGWWRSGERFALATVTRTWRSAPRPVGAAMAVSAAGEVVGSVSGGCVEADLYEVALGCLASGRPQQARYGVADDDAFAVGLSCGGTIDVFVQPVDERTSPHLEVLWSALAARQPVAVATVIDTLDPGEVPKGAGPEDANAGLAPGCSLVLTPTEVHGSLGSARLDAAVVDDARGMLAHGATGLLRLGPDGQCRLDSATVLVQSYAPPPRMIVFGAIDFAAAVAEVGAFLGYHVTVCDARAVFATPRRFPRAHEVVVAWPHAYLEQVKAEIGSRTVLCVLTHDPKFDVPLLQVALRTQAGYIGVMGSRRTHRDRLDRLRDVGVGEQELSRLRSPIGLDLGARTPQETAVSIAAEIIAALWEGTGLPLTTTTADIHR